MDSWGDYKRSRISFQHAGYAGCHALSRVMLVARREGCPATLPHSKWLQSTYRAKSFNFTNLIEPLFEGLNLS